MSKQNSKVKAAYKAATHAIYKCPEGDYLVSSETSQLFHCVNSEGTRCSCKGFRYHKKCWHLDSVAILLKAEAKVNETLQSGGQSALESLVENARRQAEKASVFQAYCYQVLANLAENLYDPLAGDFSQQRVYA